MRHLRIKDEFLAMLKKRFDEIKLRTAVERLSRPIDGDIVGPLHAILFKMLLAIFIVPITNKKRTRFW